MYVNVTQPNPIQPVTFSQNQPITQILNLAQFNLNKTNPVQPNLIQFNYVLNSLLI